MNRFPQRLRLAPAIDLLRRRVPPRNVSVAVAEHDAVLNEVKNVGAHLYGCTLWPAASRSRRELRR